MIGFLSGFLAVFLTALSVMQLSQKKMLTLSGWSKKHDNLKLYWLLTLIYLISGLSMTFYVIYY